MPRKFVKRYLPDHTSVRDHRHLNWAKPLLKHPNLWHLNRHSVAGGAAAGLLAGMIPGPVQMLTAAILAIVFRVNLPVAVASTLLTNPFTWPFFIWAAYMIGQWVTGGEAQGLTEFDFDWNDRSWGEFLPELWLWLLGLGETFLIGNLILATILAVVGYLTVQLGWRLYVWRYMQHRASRTSNPR